MATIASLIVEISARSTGLRAGLSRAQSQVTRFARSAANILKSIGKVMTAGLVGAIAGLTAIIASNSKAAKNLLDVSNAIGVSVKSLSEWSAAAKKVGIDSGKMNDILKDTADKIGDFITTGGGEAADIFERLNLNVKDFVNLNAGDSLLKVGQAMSSLTNKEQVFLMESLADEASRLIPLFSNNAQAYKAAIDEAVKSGNILTRSQAESAASFSKSVGVFKSKIAGFGKQLTVQLAKPFSLMIDWINRAIERMGGIDVLAQKFANALISGVANAIEGIGTLINYLRNIELALKKVKLAAQEAAKNITFVSAAEAAGKLVNKDFKINLFGDTSAARKEIAALEEKIKNTSKLSEDFKAKAEELRKLIGADTSGSTLDKAVSAYDKTTNSVNNLSQAADKAAKAIDPKKQESKSSASVTSLFDFKSRMEANRMDPDLTSGSGATFRGKDSSGIFGGGFTGSDGVKSIQDYINESPAGKALQDYQQGAVRRPAQIKEKPTTTITLKMVTDAGEVAGQLEGSQEFINAIARLQEKQTNTAARQAAL